MEKEILFKDVLFGLRPEYLAIEEKLKELKKYSIVLDKNIEDFSYFIIKWNKEMKPELGCKFKRKENLIQKRLHIFTSSIGYFKNKSTILVSDNNDNYNMRDDFPIIIDNSNHKEYLHELIVQILNSDFANNMIMPYFKKELFNGEFILKICSSYMDLDIQNDSMKNILSFTQSDILRYNCHNVTNGQEILNYILNELTIPSDILNEYQQDIITQNNLFDKKVYFPEISKTKESFTIEESPREFVLKKF